MEDEIKGKYKSLFQTTQELKNNNNNKQDL